MTEILYQTNEKNKITKLQTIQNNNFANISSLLLIKNDFVFTGLNDGSLLMFSFNKTLNKLIEKNKAHEAKIMSLCEIKMYVIASSSIDTTIKIWKYSLEQNQLTLLQILRRHNGAVRKIILISNNRLVSCSYYEDIIYFWNYNPSSYDLILTKSKKVISPTSLLNLKNKNNTLVISNRQAYLNFISLIEPYITETTLEGISSLHSNGLIELTNGFIAISSSSMTSCSIVIIDPFKYIKVSEIKDNNYICKCGPLFGLSDNSFVFVCENSFSHISLVDGDYKISYKIKYEEYGFFGKDTIVIVHGDQNNMFIICDNCSQGGLNILQYHS